MNTTQTATLVTCLYDVGRGEMKKEDSNFRPFTDYLTWFPTLLKLNSPMVIFIPSFLYSFVESNRDPTFPTKIIIMELEELPMANYRGQIEGIMSRLSEKGNHLRNIEFINPDYSVVILSKMFLLNRVAQEDPFGTEYFFWVDAGYIRAGPFFEMSDEWPDPSKVRLFGDKFVVQKTCLTFDKVEFRGYFLRLENSMMAAFFGGIKSILTKVFRDYLDVLERLFNEDIINNEQQIFSYLIKQNPNDYFLYPYVKVPEGEEGYRRVLKDLSRGTHMQISRPVYPGIKVVSVVSKNIKDDAVRHWDQSLEQLGYDHIILGRDSPWKGWKWRTSLYLDFVRSQSPSTVVILCDSTDLFFVGPPSEALQKFDSSGLNVIIGGESVISYAGGRHDIRRVEQFFVTRCQSKFCYPNGGFVIGRASNLLDFLQLNLDSQDDQAGYFDLLYEDKVQNTTLDYETKFIGNVPNLNVKQYIDHEVNFWEWDPKKDRFKNPISGQYPIAFHFPGSNFSVMEDFWNRINGEPPEPPPSNIKVYILIGLIIFMLILWWIWR